MYGNNYGYYNPVRNIGVPTQPINNQFMQQQMPMNNYVQQPIISGQQGGLQSGLQGKIVDNVDVVKATDIPLDGSTSYFPITDGSAIVTKQLQMDGTSKIVVFKPVVGEEKEKEEDKPKYITESYFNEKIEKLDNTDMLNNLLNEIKDFRQEIKEFKAKSKDKEK